MHACGGEWAPGRGAGATEGVPGVQMGRHHGAEMAQAAAAAAHWQRQAQLGDRLAQEVARGTQAVLQEHYARHEAVMKEASRSQAQLLAERFAEELTAERVERHQALSEVRQLTALHAYVWWDRCMTTYDTYTVHDYINLRGRTRKGSAALHFRHPAARHACGRGVCGRPAELLGCEVSVCGCLDASPLRGWARRVLCAVAPVRMCR